MSEAVYLTNCNRKAMESFQAAMDQLTNIQGRRRIFILPPMVMDVRHPHAPPVPAQRCSYCGNSLRETATCRGCGAPR